MAFTRRQVVDMLPELLTKRGVAYRPTGEVHARELGIPYTALLILGGAFIDAEAGLVSREWYRRRAPYAIKDARPATWATLIDNGLAEPAPGGWLMTDRGRGAAAEHRRRLYRYFAGLAIPREPAERTAADLDRLAARVPRSAERAERARRWGTAHADAPSVMGTISDATLVLWSFRDDCHIGAWQKAGYEGPAFDVLSYCWSSPSDVSWTRIGGMRTLDDLAKALEAKQDLADVERNVDALVARGDLERDGPEVKLSGKGQRSRDAIEQETDRAYFQIWDLDEAATSRLGEDLRAVIDSLPAA